MIVFYDILPSFEQVFLPGDLALIAPEKSVTEKIDSFQKLEQGWDYRKGTAISERIRVIAKEWVSILLSAGFKDIDAFPGGDGEVLISGVHDSYYLEVIIEDEQWISVACDVKDKQLFYELRKRPQEAFEAIVKLVGEIWTARDYFIPKNIIISETSGRGSRSEIAAGLYLLYVGNAVSATAAQYANTQGFTMGAYQASFQSLQYSGGSIPTKFLIPTNSFMIPTRTNVTGA